ncbi:hypothetical protein F5Y05DRAFT_377519 [Hypoxylon sp. FL0543]|nr:hypothetical protein F5Y05DRAFT_377519 [Hypoxylon sp. FL0543]
MEALGTAAAFAQLLGLSIKTSKAAKSLVQSFANAPDELTRLAEKLDHLHARIEQLHRLGEELPATGLLMLLPAEHQTILSSGLQTNFEALQLVQSLCSARSGTSQTVRVRLRWATLDKRRADQILGRVTTAESQLNIILAILVARLTCFNHTSLQALNASQTLLQEEFRESVETLKIAMRTEFQSILESSAQSPLKSLAAAKPILDEDFQSTRRRDCSYPNPGMQRQNQHSVRKPCDGPMLPTRQRRLDQGGETREILQTPEYEQEVDPGVRLLQHHMRRSLWYYSREYGSLRELPTIKKSRVGAMLTVQYKKARRRLRFVLDIGFNVFSQQVLRFELSLQQAVRHWTGMPTFDCSMKIFNVRSKESSIFLACQKRDLSRVRYLLESGQASIFDCDDEIGGLLEHVLQGDYRYFWYTFDVRELHRMQQVLEYLLDQGCDPNTFYGTITEDRLPGVLFAFDRGYSSAVSAMLSRGADIVSFGPLVAGLLQSLNAGFKWKVELLRGLGFCDWNAELPVAPRLSNSMLYGACEEGDFRELLFALEIAQLDPNLEGFDRRTPLAIAAKDGSFPEGVAVLIECGAEINSNIDSYCGISLIRSLRKLSWPTDTTHYLLLQGANPHLKTEYGETIWHQIWNIPCDAAGRRADGWSFIDLEGGLAHLLLHGADQFQLFLDPLRSVGYPPYNWSCSKLYLRAPEIGRSWSYGARREPRNFRSPEKWIKDFESGEDTRVPQFDISWSLEGLIYQKTSKENQQYSGGTEAAETSAISTRTTPERPAENLSDFVRNNTFFRHQTQFHHHISSPEGRRLLSRFPMVLALCDALQYAGYRAEMDDEGDIWYEIGDGDRYFDAREYHDDDEDDNPTEFCPICQDFEGHGLGHVLRKTEEAKRQLWEYREKVKAASNHCWSV